MLEIIANVLDTVLTALQTAVNFPFGVVDELSSDIFA